MKLRIWAIFSTSAGVSCRSRQGAVGSYSICKDSRASALCPSTKEPYNAPSQICCSELWTLCRRVAPLPYAAGVRPHIVSSRYERVAVPSPKSNWTCFLNLCIVLARNGQAWDYMSCAKSLWPTTGPSTSRARQARAPRLLSRYPSYLGRECVKAREVHDKQSPVSPSHKYQGTYRDRLDKFVDLSPTCRVHRPGKDKTGDLSSGASVGVL